MSFGWISAPLGYAWKALCCNCCGVFWSLAFRAYLLCVCVTPIPTLHVLNTDAFCNCPSCPNRADRLNGASAPSLLCVCVCVFWSSGLHGCCVIETGYHLEDEGGYPSPGLPWLFDSGYDYPHW